MTQDEIIASNLSELEKANERIKMLEDKLASIKQAIAELESKEPDVEETLHWYAFNYRQALHDQAHEMWLELEQFVDRKMKAPQRTEQNFCSRCGKRTKDSTHIHTCTPPQD